MDEEMKDSDRTQPVQARDEEGRPVWQHDRCGFVSSDPVLVGSEGACPADGGNASWLPLYVLSAAPDGDPAPEEQVFPAPPHRYERGPYGVDGSQACGICGSRRAAAVHRQQPQPDLMAQVREALGVKRNEDVLVAIATERANFADAAQQIARLMYERDEARAELVKALAKALDREARQALINEKGL